MEIELSMGKVAEVDPDDFDLLSKFKWSFSGEYAHRKEYPNKTVYMHRSIMGNPKGLTIDHINGNKLDNRKCNLRICAQSDNIKNTSKPRHNKSGFIGVHWDSDKARWAATISINNRTKLIGRYKTAVEAALERDEYAKKLRGQYAKLNFK